jgi:nitrite reductase (NADH) small subunit
VKRLRWFDAGPVADLRFRPGAAVRVGDRIIAIFRLAGPGGEPQYFAIDNACPHAGAPLCDGTVFGGVVVCFLHCWEFDIRTGACDVGPEWNVASHPVRLVGGRLEIGVEDAGRGSGAVLPEDVPPADVPPADFPPAGFPPAGFPPASGG